MAYRARTLITVKEFASILRVHPQTVRRWESTGYVRAARVGGSVRIDAREVRRLTRAVRR